METTNKRPLPVERLAETADALANGLIVVDTAGQVVWMDDAVRRGVNGGLHDLPLPLDKSKVSAAPCFLSKVELVIDGKPVQMCVLQEVELPGETSHELVAAVEAVMSDTSWFTRTMVEKLKAWYQAKQPAAKPDDLDPLTEREREILALICEGRSDYDMSQLLGLSQNTVRNHVASLYRKIGVNRRSAAIIWARERALTSYEFMNAKRRTRPPRVRDDK